MRGVGASCLPCLLLLRGRGDSSGSRRGGGTQPPTISALKEGSDSDIGSVGQSWKIGRTVGGVGVACLMSTRKEMEIHFTT